MTTKGRNIRGSKMEPREVKFFEKQYLLKIRQQKKIGGLFKLLIQTISLFQRLKKRFLSLGPRIVIQRSETIKKMVTWRMISCCLCLRRSRSICKDCRRSFCWQAWRFWLLWRLVLPGCWSQFCGSNAPEVGALWRCVAANNEFSHYIILSQHESWCLVWKVTT